MTRVPATGPALADEVSRWYAVARRPLPWREPSVTAYQVLVSEVMLQQTPVSRVLPAYRAWVERWPTPQHLAAASPADVLIAWGRLGYPRRALRLHEAARRAVADHGGDLPRHLPDLLALPGVGPYTARAVAVFAFGQRHPVIDVNVRRVVARAVEGRAHSPVRAADLALVDGLLPTDPARAATASAAMMELGALVCVSREPRCAECPLRGSCAWLAAGRPDGAAPPRRQPPYAGSDREARGALLAVLRTAGGRPVAGAELAAACPEPGRRERAVASLLADGLLVARAGGDYAFPAGATPLPPPGPSRRDPPAGRRAPRPASAHPGR